MALPSDSHEIPPMPKTCCLRPWTRPGTVWTVSMIWINSMAWIMQILSSTYINQWRGEKPTSRFLMTIPAHMALRTKTVFMPNYISHFCCGGEHPSKSLLTTYSQTILSAHSAKQRAVEASFPDGRWFANSQL